MSISNRKFGVEIECMGAPATTILQAFQDIGVSCYHDGRTAVVRDGWKLTYDGSVHNNNGGGENCWEIVSPPLSGEDGLEQIQKVTRALVAIGIHVNRTCGLHVHVDASGLSGIDLANMAMRYAHFEREIDTFMPASRRDSVNAYCQGMSYAVENIRRFNNLESVSCDDIAGAVRSRYHKLNLNAYLRHGTIEFRQHSGSVNGTKITNWIRFCVNFVENSKMNPENYSVVPETISVSNNTQQNNGTPEYTSNGFRIYRRNSCMAYSCCRIVDALNNNRLNGDGCGVSVETLAQLVNCNPASIPSMISQIRRAYSGLGTRALRKSRQSGNYMLRGCILATPAQNFSAYVSAPVVQETRQIRRPNFDFRNDTWSRGLDSETISFYQERTMDFSA